MGWNSVLARTIPERLLAALFVLWLAISIMGQAGLRVVARVRSYDLLDLIPAYRFFAPYPRFSDYLLEYRSDQTPWSTVVTSHPRSWKSAFWNPEKRSVMAFHTSAGRLLAHQRAQGQASARLSLAYLQVLRLVENAAASLPSTSVQFRLMSLRKHDPAAPTAIVFCSDWHHLPR